MRRLSKKWANYRRRWYYLRAAETTPTGPLYINIEPTNACNLNCYMCSIDGTRKRGMMDMELFRRLVDEAYESGTYEVALFLGGEPVMHKQLPDMIRHVGQKGLESRVYTNACLLTPERAEAILDAGLTFMGVSIDGDNKEEYESMRIGANFDEVMANLTYFLKLKQEKGLDKPYVSLQMIKLLENPNQDASPEFRERFRDLPLDEIAVRNPHNWRGEKDGILQEEHGGLYYPCQVFWSAMSVAWDGRVVGCSADLNGNFILGDLKQQSIMEVWNGDEYRRHRRLMKQKRYGELGLCAECHALWHEHHPRLSLAMQLPPLEQIRNGARHLSPKRQREADRRASAGAIRNRRPDKG